MDGFLIGETARGASQPASAAVAYLRDSSRKGYSNGNPLDRGVR